jgi:FkbM family methyltransferase
MTAALGRLARAARALGLGRALRVVVALADAALLRLHVAPLRVVVQGVPVRGLLRHRSFLAEAAQPRSTYAELYLRLLTPGMTVVDGGAHVGLYSKLAAPVAAHVVAVEPDAYNLAALHLNLDGLANVEIVPCALAEREGTATFYDTRSTIGSSLLERPDATPHEVRTTSVDAILDGREVESLLVKLNIEGAEPLAIAGMRQTLERVERVAMLVEVNPPLLAAAGTDVEELLDGLRARGFEVAYVDLAAQIAVELPRPLRKGHLLVSRSA